MELNDCRLWTEPHHFRYTLPSANRLHAFIFLCSTNPWVKYPRNSVLFLNFERILYWYEIKAYFKKKCIFKLFYFQLKYTICVLSSLLLCIVGRMRCELKLTSEHCYNIVRNTLILNMMKPTKRVFRLSDFQTAVQQKLVSTMWSLFIERYTYSSLDFFFN